LLKLKLQFKKIIKGSKEGREWKEGKEGGRKGGIFYQVISIFCFPEQAHKQQCQHTGTGDLPRAETGKNKRQREHCCPGWRTGEQRPGPSMTAVREPGFTCCRSLRVPLRHTRIEHGSGKAEAPETGRLCSRGSGLRAGGAGLRSPEGPTGQWACAPGSLRSSRRYARLPGTGPPPPGLVQPASAVRSAPSAPRRGSHSLLAASAARALLFAAWNHLTAAPSLARMRCALRK